MTVVSTGSVYTAVSVYVPCVALWRLAGGALAYRSPREAQRGQPARSAPTAEGRMRCRSDELRGPEPGGLLDLLLIGGLDPLAQRLVVDSKLPGDLGNRALGRGLHQRNRVATELLRVLRRAWHTCPFLWTSRSKYQGVHFPGDGPDDSARCVTSTGANWTIAGGTSERSGTAFARQCSSLGRCQRSTRPPP
jgi:hypothetical protein